MQTIFLRIEVIVCIFVPSSQFVIVSTFYENHDENAKCNQRYVTRVIWTNDLLQKSGSNVWNAGLSSLSYTFFILEDATLSNYKIILHEVGKPFDSE